MIARDKHSSLFRLNVIDEEKKFYSNEFYPGLVFFR